MNKSYFTSSTSPSHIIVLADTHMRVQDHQNRLVSLAIIMEQHEKLMNCFLRNIMVQKLQINNIAVTYTNFAQQQLRAHKQLQGHIIRTIPSRLSSYQLQPLQHVYVYAHHSAGHTPSAQRMEHAKHSLLPLRNYMHAQLSSKIIHQPIIFKHIYLAIFTHTQLPASVVWDEKIFKAHGLGCHGIGRYSCKLLLLDHTSYVTS